MQQQPDAAVGDWVHCPVSGVPVHVSESSTRVVVEGHGYVVCCPGCATQLQADPMAFLRPVCRAATVKAPSTLGDGA